MPTAQPSFQHSDKTFNRQKNRPDHNEAFEDLCDTETPYALEFPYLLVPQPIPYEQLVTLRLRCQKLRLNNSVFFYVNRPK